MTSDHRIGLGPDPRRPGRAAPARVSPVTTTSTPARPSALIGDLARVYEGTQDHPYGPSITQASYLPAPPERPGPEPNLDRPSPRTI